MRPMSSELICAAATKTGLPASTAAAKVPAGGPNSRLPTLRTSRMPAKPISAAQSRDTQSWMPSTSKKPAVAQYCSGGFSKYLKPFSRGVIQSPDATISRGISA